MQDIPDTCFHVDCWILCVALANPLVVQNCSCAGLSQHTATDLWRCITLRIRAIFFSYSLFYSLSTAKFIQLCFDTPDVIPCVSGYKNSLGKSLWAGSGFLGNDFFFFFISDSENCLKINVQEEPTHLCCKFFDISG